MSICSIEDVAAAVDKPFWFQLYVMRDRGFVRSLIERAIAAKCSALVLTVDLQVLGQRHRDVKNGMTVREAVIDLGFVERGEVTEAQLDSALDVLAMTRPPQA